MPIPFNRQIKILKTFILEKMSNLLKLKLLFISVTYKKTLYNANYSQFIYFVRFSISVINNDTYFKQTL